MSRPNEPNQNFRPGQLVQYNRNYTTDMHIPKGTLGMLISDWIPLYEGGFSAWRILTSQGIQFVCYDSALDLVM